MTSPAISDRSKSLGTENAFVVLAEVNKLQRGGKDIISFCIGQPDFPTPKNIQDAAIEAIRSGKHGYTPSAGIRGTARGGGAISRQHARPHDYPG